MSTTRDPWRILVVDDEPLLRSVCVSLLVAWGYAVCEARDGEEALALEAQIHIDAVLLDVHMPRLPGDAVLAVLRKRRPDLPVVMMSSDIGALQARVRELGARSFLSKPFAPTQLRHHISRALA